MSPATAALHGKCVGPRPLNARQQQDTTVVEQIRAAVLVAGSGVEPEQEQVRREQRVQSGDSGEPTVRDGPAAPEQLIDLAAVRRRDTGSVPSLASSVVEAIRTRGPIPEVEHDGHPARVVVPVDHSTSREHLATDHREVRDGPEMDVVDLRGETMPGTAQLVRRRRVLDRRNHLGVPPVALDARHEDVGGHRNQSRLERGALRRQRERSRCDSGYPG